MLGSLLWFRFLYSANVSRDGVGGGGQGYFSNHEAGQPHHQKCLFKGEENCDMSGKNDTYLIQNNVYGYS